MRLATHSGSFHTDDVFAYAVLKTIFPNHELIRSRDSKILDTCDIVFDVGGGKYDHHMRNKPFRTGDKSNFAYSSFGLIWRDFGRGFLTLLGVKDALKEEVWESMDSRIVLSVDMNDNGQSKTPDDVFDFTIPHLVDMYNYDVDDSNDDELLIRFQEVSQVAVRFLRGKVDQLVNAINSAKKVLDAYNIQKSELLILDESMPYVTTIHKHNLNVKMVVEPGRGQWRMYAIPDNKGIAFANRALLPDEWRGLTGDELQTVSNIATALFVHPAGFTGGASTKEDAVAMARQFISQDV